jgi:hypothetical protein
MENQLLEPITLLPRLAFIEEWDSQIQATDLIRALPFRDTLHSDNESHSDDKLWIMKYSNEIERSRISSFDAKSNQKATLLRNQHRWRGGHRPKGEWEEHSVMHVVYVPFPAVMNPLPLIGSHLGQISFVILVMEFA